MNAWETDTQSTPVWQLSEDGGVDKHSLGQLLKNLQNWLVQEVWFVYHKEILLWGSILASILGLVVAYKLGQSRNPDVKLSQLMRNLKYECTKKASLDQSSARYKMIIKKLNWLIRGASIICVILLILLLLNLKSASLLPFVIELPIDNVQMLLIILGTSSTVVLLYLFRIWCFRQLRKLDSSARASAQNAEHLLEGLIAAFGEDLRAEIAGQLLIRLHNSHQTLQEKLSEITTHLGGLLAEEAKTSRIQKFYEDKVQSILSFRWAGVHSMTHSPNQKAKSSQSLENKDPTLKLQPADSSLTVDKKDTHKKFDFPDAENLKSPRSQDDHKDSEHPIDRTYTSKLKQWFKLMKQIKQEIESNPELCGEDNARTG